MRCSIWQIRLPQNVTNYATFGFIWLHKTTLAQTHHEKWDGTGYPRGLKGKDVSLMCRIVPIADVFDALTSERPYKKAWTPEKAVEVIQKDAGTHFDPTLVEAFMDVLPEVLKIKKQYAD
jgi:putative two-component system response regulator